MPTLILLLAVLFPAAAAEVRYTCPAGDSFTVRYLNNPEPGYAVLEAEGRPPIVLPHAPSGSGAKYSDGYTVLWTQGEEAILESGTLNARGCRAQRPPQTQASLRGRYALVELAGRPVPAATPAWLEFDPAALRASGSTGCNRFSSGYEHNGQSLKFQGAVSTRMACPSPAMELEDRFLKALNAVASFRSEGALLVLLDAGGQTLARLRANP